jgi:hypothetical protein
MIKATIYKFLQRADGWCESVKGLNLSTFGAVSDKLKAGNLYLTI